MKILDMISKGIITPEEGKVLLDALETSSEASKAKRMEEIEGDILEKEEFREQSQHAKKMSSANEKLKDSLKKMKEGIKKGYHVVDKALGKVDKAIIDAFSSQDDDQETTKEEE